MATEVVARITLTIILFEKLHASRIIMVDSSSNYGRIKHHLIMRLFEFMVGQNETWLKMNST